MEFEKTIRKAIEAYPLIYPYRYYVLEHLFLSIGNGSEWINGELCYLDPLEKWTPELWDKMFMPTIPNEFHRNEIRSLQVIVNSSKERSMNKTEFPKHIYPGNQKYSRICLLPDNIKKSWRDGILEFHERLLEKDLDSSENIENARSLTLFAVKKLNTLKGDF